MPCYFEEEQFVAILKSYMNQLLEPMVGRLGPGELFVEKTPAHALCLKEIHELLPDCRVIHVLRDGRDVVASLLAAGRSWGAGWAPREPREAAKTWAKHVRAARAAAEYFPDRQFREITYEQLQGSTLGTLKQLANFLGLEWAEEDMQVAIKANQADSVRSGQGTPIPVYGEVARQIGEAVKDPPEFVWQARSGNWRQDLSLWEKFWVWRIARKTLRETGYSWGTESPRRYPVRGSAGSPAQP